MRNYRVNITLIWIIVFVTQGFTLSALSPDTDVIVLTLWTELDKVPSVINSDTGLVLSKNEIAKRTLEDARWILSGMIYGFDVRYVPLDRERQVSEIFRVALSSEIPFGDPSLRVFKTWTENERFFIQIRYALQEFQQRRLRAWSSNIFPWAEGKGKAPLFNGRSGRLDAVKDGIKEALRGYLRLKIKNKPREIDARVILDQPPYITLQAGGYMARVRIKFSIKKVVPYTVY